MKLHLVRFGTTGKLIGLALLLQVLLLVQVEPGECGRAIRQQIEVTSINQVNQSRTGITTTAVPQTIRTSMGDRVVDVAFVPFIRSRDVQFSATRMKPNTRVYPFFDNIDITSYITPTNGSLGGNLITDANVLYQVLFLYLIQK